PVASFVLGLAACTPGLRPSNSGTTPVPLSSGPDRATPLGGAADRRSAALTLTSSARTTAAPPITAEDATAAVAGLFGTAPAARRDSDAEVAWDIDVSYATRDRVEHYVDRFTGSARAPFSAWLRRGTRYEGMIR